jgi:hypothetical protein
MVFRTVATILGISGLISYTVELIVPLWKCFVASNMSPFARFASLPRFRVTTLSVSHSFHTALLLQEGHLPAT